MFLGTQRRFGVEIEFAGGISRETLARELNTAGVQCQSEYYNHSTRSYWKLTTDASCGYEMVSPILQGEEGFQQLKKVLDIMTEMGCTVNRSTGVHVHLEAADLSALDVKNIVTRYADNEAEIDTWFPRSRRAANNQYCRPVSQGIDVSFRNVDEGALDAERATSAQSYMRHRFCKVNLNSLSRYNTIEFRQHHGSTSFAKISNWVLFLQHFVEQSRKVKASEAVMLQGRRSKTRPFNFLRKTLEAKGFEVSYTGRNRVNRTWKVSKDGSTRLYTTRDFSIMYESVVSDAGIEQDAPRLSQEWLATMFDATDASLNASVPSSVVDFFNQRRDLLAA